MKKPIIKTISLLTFVTVIAVNFATASEFLPIRNRVQWLENNGYCGETSLQECALYFGIYASQAWIRNVIDPAQSNDLVELEEWAQVLQAMGLKADYFPTDRVAPPQYKSFEVWAKQHLARKHPVITTCYLPFGSTDPVDHIITLTGFGAGNTTTYNETDVFSLNHHLAQTTEGLPGAPFAFSQQARWLFDERSMTGPGATYGYAIQKQVNYALAIKGTSNLAPEARPVRVELEGITEPNVIAGETPTLLSLEITVEGLMPGRSYVLYHYDDPAQVPTACYAAKPSLGKLAFVACDRTQTFRDTVASDGVAVFRCLPQGR